MPIDLLLSPLCDRSLMNLCLEQVRYIRVVVYKYRLHLEYLLYTIQYNLLILLCECSSFFSWTRARTRLVGLCMYCTARVCLVSTFITRQCRHHHSHNQFTFICKCIFVHIVRCNCNQSAPHQTRLRLFYLYLLRYRAYHSVRVSVSFSYTSRYHYSFFYFVISSHSDSSLVFLHSCRSHSRIDQRLLLVYCKSLCNALLIFLLVQL